jgi:hypothetical protein
VTRTTFRALTRVLVVLCIVSSAAGAGTAFAASTSVTATTTSAQVTSLVTKIKKVVGSSKQIQAAQILQSPTCGFGASSQVFLPWSDTASYALAPQGDVSATSAWTLSNTTVVANHDPYTSGANSLRIAGNGAATSPAMCVDLATPTIRYFVTTTAPSMADLKVSVLYEDLSGNIKSLDLAKITAGATWQPSALVPIVVNTSAAYSASGWTAVAFVFTPERTPANQTWSIGSLYVDPYRKV